MSKRIEPNDYITVEHLDISRQIGFVARLNTVLSKENEQSKFNLRCSNTERLKFDYEVAKQKEMTLPPFPLSRKTTVDNIETNFCAFVDFDKRREEYLKGYKGDFSSLFRDSFNNSLIQRLYSTFIISSTFADEDEWEEEEQRDEVFSKDNLQRTISRVNFEDVDLFTSSMREAVGSSLSRADELESICTTGECIQTGYKKLEKKLAGCSQKITKAYEDARTLGKAKYGDNEETLSAYNTQLSKAYETAVKESLEVEGSIEEAALTGQSMQIKNVLHKYYDKVLESKVNRENLDLKLNQEHQAAREILLEKKKNGEPLSSEEVKIVANESVSKKIDIIDSTTGELVETKETTISDYYNIENKVAANSDADNMEAEVVDYSMYDKGKRLEEISSRIMLEAERRGKSISAESALRVAEKYQSIENPIINFDKLFGLNASTPETKEEVEILKESLSLNRGRTRATRIKKRLANENISQEERLGLTTALGKIKKTNTLRSNSIAEKIRKNPNLGRIAKGQPRINPKKQVSSPLAENSSKTRNGATFNKNKTGSKKTLLGNNGSKKKSKRKGKGKRRREQKLEDQFPEGAFSNNKDFDDYDFSNPSNSSSDQGAVLPSSSETNSFNTAGTRTNSVPASSARSYPSPRRSSSRGAAIPAGSSSNSYSEGYSGLVSDDLEDKSIPKEESDRIRRGIASVRDAWSDYSKEGETALFNEVVEEESRKAISNIGLKQLQFGESTYTEIENGFLIIKEEIFKLPL
jgi:hypothetical protein